VSLAQLRDIYINQCSFELYEQAWEDIDTSAIAVQKIVDKGDTAYGINTGFGLLAQTRVEDDQLALLQRNLCSRTAQVCVSLLIQPQSD
jgi:histidine ammonia-lyase